MSLRRTMDDLDALLADLQATTLGHITSSSSSTMDRDYDNRQAVPSTGRPPITSNVMSCGTPTYDLITDVEGQPLYEPQQMVRPQPPLPVSAATGSKQVPEGVPIRSRLQQQQHPAPLTASTRVAPGTRQVSTLSSNLSELDSLLAELSSAQFNIEVDRRTGGSLVSPPGGSMFNANKERSVDSLLNDLDNTLPIARHGTSGSTSVATQDLDDLMASLSGMTTINPQDGRVPSYALPDKSRTSVQSPDVAGSLSSGSPLPSDMPGSQSKQNNISLSEMMKTLDDNMTRQGVTTIPKGHCAACAKPIVGQVITALARLWHPEHFMCVHCKEPIGTRNFFERDSQPYCEHDYHLLFSPYCASCNGPIFDKCLTALDKTWHPEHFCCSHCGHQLSDEEGFHERDGLVYCRRDYYELFAPRCGACSKPIVENFINALNKQWHPQCFVCRECHMSFGAGNFFEHEGFPYCETHFHAVRGSLCASCSRPITGRCITAMYKKFHPEHFVCTFCQRQLNKGTFKEENDKPYCHPCFVRLFS